MTIERILKKAERHLSKEGDDKCWGNPSDFAMLIRAGAIVLGNEYQNSEKHWVTNMNYDGYIFVIFSKSKLTQ